jgi:hypothetical protein
MSDCPDSGQTINRRQLRVALAEPNVSHAEKENIAAKRKQGSDGIIGFRPKLG